jgi:hypothetical protein
MSRLIAPLLPLRLRETWRILAVAAAGPSGCTHGVGAVPGALGFCKSVAVMTIVTQITALVQLIGIAMWPVALLLAGKW